ncbi:hypothetical protein AHAS_Ahas12G0027300 [Arachis hypogaea]
MCRAAEHGQRNLEGCVSLMLSWAYHRILLVRSDRFDAHRFPLVGSVLARQCHRREQAEALQAYAEGDWDAECKLSGLHMRTHSWLGLFHGDSRGECLGGSCLSTAVLRLRYRRVASGGPGSTSVRWPAANSH